MSSRQKKSKKIVTDEEFRSSLQKPSSNARLEDMLTTVSLKDIPLEERRKEAQKPLFLERYE